MTGVAAPQNALTLPQTLAITCVGVLSTFTIGTMPALLGAAVADGIIPVDLLGVAATAQAAAVFAALMLFNLFGRFRRLRLVAAIGLVVMALGLVLSAIAAEPVLLIASRVVTGAAEGMLMWMAAGGVVRAPQPVRVQGAQIMGAGLLRIGLVAVLTTTLIPVLGSRPGWLALAVLPLLGLLVVRMLPAEFPDAASASSSRSSHRARRVPALGLLSLIVVFFFVPGVQIVSLYAAPLAEHFGHSDGATLALNLMSVGNLVGGGLAMLSGSKLRYFPVLAFSFFTVAGLVAVAAFVPDGLAFGVAVGLMSFVHFFRNPFFVGASLAADPTKRAALFNGPTVMIANIVFQTLSSVLVSILGVNSVLGLAVLTSALGLAALLALQALIARTSRTRS